MPGSNAFQLNAILNSEMLDLLFEFRTKVTITEPDQLLDLRCLLENPQNEWIVLLRNHTRYHDRVRPPTSRLPRLSIAGICPRHLPKLRRRDSVWDSRELFFCLKRCPDARRDSLHDCVTHRNEVIAHPREHTKP